MAYSGVIRIGLERSCKNPGGECALAEDDDGMAQLVFNKPRASYTLSMSFAHGEALNRSEPRIIIEQPMKRTITQQKPHLARKRNRRSQMLNLHREIGALSKYRIACHSAAVSAVSPCQIIAQSIKRII